MNFDWTTYFALAEELLKQAKDPTFPNPALKEARLRSALSRAYYAVYIKARNYLIAKNEYWPSESDNEHIYIRNKFKDNYNRVRDQISQDLNRLRTDRNMADYDNATDPNLETIATFDIAVARRALANLDKLK